MAGGRNTEIGSCCVTAIPFGKGYRFSHDWIPFVESQKPQFELIINQIEGHKRRHS
jgi:hypothetical protein